MKIDNKYNKPARKLDETIISIIYLLFIILLFYAIVISFSIVSANEINISHNINYNNNLEFNWSYENNLNIYINGELKEENSSIQAYIIQNCEDGDRYKINIESIDKIDSGELDITIPYKFYSSYTYFLIIIWFILVLCMVFIHEIFIIPSLIFNSMIFWDIFSYANNQYQFIFAGIMFIITFSVCAFASKVEK